MRVVDDYSARFMGHFAQQTAVKRPGFLHSLTEAVIRFRSEKVAVVADIKQMFH